MPFFHHRPVGDWSRAVHMFKMREIDGVFSDLEPVSLDDPLVVASVRERKITPLGDVRRFPFGGLAIWIVPYEYCSASLDDLQQRESSAAVGMRRVRHVHAPACRVEAPTMKWASQRRANDSPTETEMRAEMRTISIGHSDVPVRESPQDKFAAETSPRQDDTDCKVVT